MIEQKIITNNDGVDVGVTARRRHVIRRAAAVAGQVIFITRPAPSFTARSLRPRILCCRRLRRLGGGRCHGSLLGGSVDVGLVQLAPEQPMKQARLLARSTR